ncbi:MAG TPA: hypothetical protein VGP74_04495 [Rubrobacteraceae bacterium]|jgi:hypothetical protein|nr:hypothetical protein [Rubrobacteraceae bacterium]
MGEHEQELENRESAHDGLRLVSSHDDIAVGLTFRERLGWEKIVEGRKKLAAWGHSRDDVDRKTGRPTWKQLTFDREVDRYTETVTVKATGEVIVKKDYQLSEKGKRKQRQADRP